MTLYIRSETTHEAVVTIMMRTLLLKSAVAFFALVFLIAPATGDGGAEEQVCTSSSGNSCSSVVGGSSGSVTVTTTTAEILPSGEQQPPLSSPSPPLLSPEEIAKLYGVPQSLAGYDASHLLKVDEYMRTVVQSDERYKDVKDHCKNDHESCTFWATLGAEPGSFPPVGGECDKNPTYMLTTCGPACGSCHKLIFEERCPLPSNLHETNVWKAGDVNQFFTNITTHPHYQQYHPSIICQPGMHNDHLKGDCPWVVIMDEFLTENECDTLIELGALEGYKRSEDVGARKPDGSYAGVQSSGRTSTNAWCTGDKCYKNATVQSILQRIENLTGIPDANSEYLQLLRYEVGQFYQSHHDYIEHNTKRAQGPRIITVFLYLNDVEAGGATHFTDLNISVYPKRGRALIWPSVKDKDPTAKDLRTHHQAMPVEAGIKFGANAWVR
jgi:prolyl 4-hydroxylase